MGVVDHRIPLAVVVGLQAGALRLALVVVATGRRGAGGLRLVWAVGVRVGLVCLLVPVAGRWP